MAGRNIEDKIRCSFCGKSQEQVRKMIAGPNGAFICDECVEVCTEIIEEEFEEEENVQPEGMAEEIHLYIQPMTENERRIVKAGCLINFNRNR